MSERATSVLIAGGGVAALELMLALRALAERRVEIELLSAEHEFGYRPWVVERGRLVVTSGDPVATDRVVTLPVLEGTRLLGVPHDAEGFTPTDLYGRVEGLDGGVFAAGDATTFSVKQGGIATQQADVVAKSIAALAGAPVTPEPFRPVLRGLLLTGSTPGYLQAELRGGQGEATGMEMEPEPLWWPPRKIAGHYLSRGIAPLVAAEPPPQGGIRIEIDDLEPLLGSGQ